MSATSNVAYVCEIHEERLQSLEKDRTELMVEIAELNAGIKLLNVSVCSRLEQVTEGISLLGTELKASVKDLDNKIHTNSLQINKLEAEETKGEKWRDWGRKVLYFDIVSGIGVMVTLFTQYLNK